MTASRIGNCCPHRLCLADPHRVHVSGTGLTHLGSARDRQAMHVAATAQEQAQMTDSMRMFEWGRQQGRPADGEIGIAPEWFYKGDGSIVQAPFGPLPIPGLPKTEEKKLKSRPSTWSRTTVLPGESEWLQGTNSPITSSNAAIISIWRVRRSARGRRLFAEH